MQQQLITQIKRSAPFQVLAIFLASGWAVLQIIDAFIDNGLLPAWSFKAAVVMLLIGLPVVLATAVVQGMRARSERGEVDAGDVTRSNDVAASSASVKPRANAAHRVFTWRNAALGGVAAFALLGLFAGGWMGMRVLGIGAPGTLLAQGVLERGAAVVLADFDSGDDADLADVVVGTLRIDLMQSPLIRVLDRTELNAPLTRMQAEPDTRITSEIATQLAEREGYAAVITGTVARAGTSYVLTASVRAGDGFLPVAGFREIARNDQDLVDAIERLSRSIRDKAGESLRTVQGGTSLEQVTTSSLPALREYTRGEARLYVRDFSGALDHYERAVALDSMFAMAHRKVASMLTNLVMRRRDAVRAYRRAYELRDRLPPLERQLAIAAYAEGVLGDPGAAVSAYEQALAVDSTNLAVRNNLANGYRRLGRYDEAAQLYAAALRTRSAPHLFGNLATTRFEMGNLAAALATVDSGMAQLPAWTGGYYFKALFSIARLDVAAADSFGRLLEQKAQMSHDREDSRFVQFSLAALRGRLRDAERVLDGPLELDLADPINRASMRAHLNVMRGDTAAAVKLVRDALAANEEAEDGSFYEAVYALAQARAGADAQNTLADWRAATPDDQLGTFGRFLRTAATGATQRAQRDFDGALRTLQELQRRWPGLGVKAFYHMAQTYDEMDNAAAAIEWYEKALAAFNPDAVNYVPQIPLAVRRLGELYDAQGNTAKAVEYYARFTELWRDADPELQPMVRRAQDRLNVLLPQRR